MALRITLVKGQDVFFDKKPARFLGKDGANKSAVFDWEGGLVHLNQGEKIELFPNCFMWFSGDKRSSLSLFLDADPKINISRGKKP